FQHIWQALSSREIRYAARLSLLSCSLAALLSVRVAGPICYLMSRYQFRGKALLDALLDIPIVLPPLVIGLSLLILFQTPPGRAVENAARTAIPWTVTYGVLCVLIPAAGALDLLLLIRTAASGLRLRPSRAFQATVTLL